MSTMERPRSRTAAELLADLTGQRRPEPPPEPAADGMVFVPHDSDPTAPHVRLRMALEAARADGIPFDDVWRIAVRECVMGIGEQRERNTWYVALADTREEWRAAYYGFGQRLTVFDNLIMGARDD
jgi:hypothetical protein